MVWTEVWFTMPCCSLLRLWKCQHPESPEIPEELLNIAGKHQHDHYLVEFPTHVCSTWNAKSHSLALQTDQRPVNTVSPSDSESWQNGAARAAIGNYISFLHWFSEVHYPHAYKFSITSCSKGGVQSSIKHPMQPSPICGGVSNQTPKIYQTITHKDPKKWVWFCRNNTINWKLSVIPKGLLKKHTHSFLCHPHKANHGAPSFLDPSQRDWSIADSSDSTWWRLRNPQQQVGNIMKFTD